MNTILSFVALAAAAGAAVLGYLANSAVPGL